MKFSIKELHVLLLMLVSTTLFSGIAAANGDDPKPAPTQAVDKEYIIGVDDILSISAVGIDEVMQTLTVLTDGSINITGIKDKIIAEGLTVAQLKEKVYSGLIKLYNNLNLTVSIKESRSRVVTILGTKNSGVYPLRKGMRISDLIALGGGLPTKTKQLIGTLTRSLRLIRLDLNKIAGEKQESTSDLTLEVGDTLTIVILEEAPAPTYSIIGQVAKQGTYPLPLDGTQVGIARAFAESGGQTERAALTKVVLQRKGAKSVLNLYPLLIEGKTDDKDSQLTLIDLAKYSNSSC